MSHDFDPQRPGGSFSLGWCNVSDCYAHADSPARMAAPCPLSMLAAYEIERIDAISPRWRARQDAPATRDPSDYPAERAKLYEKAQVIFKEQAPWFTIAHAVQLKPVRKEVIDFKLSPFGRHNFYGVDIKE